MGRAVKRKQASSKLEIKRNNGMSSGIFKCSLPFIYIYIFLLTVFSTSSAVNVQWEAKFPVVFGNVTYLQCNISDTASNCANKDRQWIGGPHYDGLCYEDECPTFKKYQVMKQPRCLYTLMIYNFSERDVNCEYTCLYGASRMRQNLTLDKKKFIYVPYKRDITQEYEVQDNISSWRINVEKIYPEPSCVADFNGKNITNGMKISVTKPGFYFATELQIIYNLSSCGKIYVSCFLGEYKINITSMDFNNCQGGTNRNIGVGTVIMSAAVLVATISTIVAVCVIIYRRKKLTDTTLINNEEVDSYLEKERKDKKKERKPDEVVRSLRLMHVKTDNTGRAEYSNEILKPPALQSIGQASDSPRPLPQKPTGTQLDPLSDSTSERKKKKKRKKKESKQSDEGNQSDS